MSFTLSLDEINRELDMTPAQRKLYYELREANNRMKAGVPLTCMKCKGLPCQCKSETR